MTTGEELGATFRAFVAERAEAWAPGLARDAADDRLLVLESTGGSIEALVVWRDREGGELTLEVVPCYHWQFGDATADAESVCESLCETIEDVLAGDVAFVVERDGERVTGASVLYAADEPDALVGVTGDLHRWGEPVRRVG